MGKVTISLDEKRTDRFLVTTDQDMSLFGLETKDKFHSYYMKINPWNLADLFKNKTKFQLDIDYADNAKPIVELLRNDLKVYQDGAKIRRYTDKQAIAEWERMGFPDLFPKIEAMPHQMKMVLWLLKIKKGGCFMEQGTGKTPVGILWLGYLLFHDKLTKPLVVAPLDLLSDTVWFKDLEKFSELKPIDLTDPKQFYNPVGNIYFCNPEKFMSWCFRTTEKAERSYNKDNFFEMLRPDGIFFDEASQLKTHASYKTKAFIEISRHAKFIGLASGCPAPNKPFQYFAQMEVLGNVLGDNYTAFQCRYGVKRSVGPTEIYFPTANADMEIRARIDLVSYFVKRDDVLNLLPRKEFEVKVDLHPEHMALIKAVEKDYTVVAKAINEKGEEVAGKILVEHEMALRIKLLRMIDGFTEFTDEDGKNTKVSLPWNAKLDKLDEMITKILADKSSNIIIWCRFRCEVDTIYNKYKQFAQFAYGGMTKESRNANLNHWLDNEGCRLLVATSRSVKYGHTWLKANKSIYFSGTDDYEDYTQSRDRNYRYGQDREVTEYRLIANKTVEGNLWTGIRGKQKTDRFMKDYYAKLTI